jgi:hypothetical protein
MATTTRLTSTIRILKFIRTSIPGCERAVLKTMYPYALARETYRTEGEYVITEDDFMKDELVGREGFRQH